MIEYIKSVFVGIVGGILVFFVIGVASLHADFHMTIAEKRVMSNGTEVYRVVFRVGRDNVNYYCPVDALELTPNMGIGDKVLVRDLRLNCHPTIAPFDN